MLSEYKGYHIERFQGTQVSYGASERQAKGLDIRLCDFTRTRKCVGVLVVEPDGYQRFFNTLKEAKKWIDGQSM